MKTIWSSTVPCKIGKKIEYTIYNNRGTEIKCKSSMIQDECETHIAESLIRLNGTKTLSYNNRRKKGT